MKLLRLGALGREWPAVLDAAGNPRDLSAHVRDLSGDGLSPESLRRLAGLDVEALPRVEEGVRIGPCVARPSKIVAIGLNYADPEKSSRGFGVRDEPVLYMKASNCVAGPYDNLAIPLGATKLDWEVELGVVIGTEGIRITPDRAQRHIAGYCIVNDVTERAWQHERGGQWVKGKSADGFAPLGPWLVTPDELPSLASARIRLELDGEVMQSAAIGDMVWDAPSLVAYVSQFMRLVPGDVIATGTPRGVGFVRQPPRFLQTGEMMVLRIDGLGEQRTKVVGTLQGLASERLAST